jgi:predicted nucleic acid-binding protein
MVTEEFKDALVFLDTAPLIYFIEGHSEYQKQLSKIFRYNDDNYFRFLTSSITLLEVLVKPLKDGEAKVVEQYKKILSSAPGLYIFDITSSIAIRAAEIRAKYNARTPDALQVATAIEQNADFFLTNDLRLKVINEIKIISIAELE